MPWVREIGPTTTFAGPVEQLVKGHGLRRLAFDFGWDSAARRLDDDS